MGLSGSNFPLNQSIEVNIMEIPHQQIHFQHIRLSGDRWRHLTCPRHVEKRPAIAEWFWWEGTYNVVPPSYKLVYNPHQL